MYCFADLPQHTRTSLKEAGSWRRTLRKLVSLWIGCVFIWVCVHRPDCWPKIPAELWCCPEQLVSHKKGGGGAGGRPPGPSGHLFTHRSKRWHATQEDRECHTSHTVESSGVSHYGTSSRCCQPGFDVQRERAGGDTAAWYGLASPCLKSLLGQGLSYLQKEMKTAAMTVIGTLFGRWDKRLELITICTHPVHQPSWFPGAFKTLLCRHFFFFFLNPQAWNFL